MGACGKANASEEDRLDGRARPGADEYSLALRGGVVVYSDNGKGGERQPDGYDVAISSTHVGPATMGTLSRWVRVPCPGSPTGPEGNQPG